MTTIAPPPPAATTPPLTPGGRKAVRVTLVAAASVLVVGCVMALGATAWGINSLRVFTESKNLPVGMRSLTIDGADASVRVEADPQVSEPRVDLRLLNSTRGGQQRLAVTTDADGTHVRLAPESSSFMGWSRASELTVTLPPELARLLALTTQQADGDLMVEADVDQLIARTNDGDVALAGGARHVDITARDGNVIARKPVLVTDSFVVDAADGDVDVEFAGVAPRKIEATSRDGDVEISLPAIGPYLVQTQSGDSATVTVPETSDPARAVSQVKVRSIDGNVVVRTVR